MSTALAQAIRREHAEDDSLAAINLSQQEEIAVLREQAYKQAQDILVLSQNVMLLCRLLKEERARHA